MLLAIVPPAGVAQLAEHNVANVVVVGSNPITRSLFLFFCAFHLAARYLAARHLNVRRPGPKNWFGGRRS